MIGITGGIGAGKSVVSRVMRLRGNGVYDCDSEARRIMDSDTRLHEDMRLHLGEDALTEEGEIDRKAVARYIFGDEEKRRWLNSVVHKKVREDLMRWAGESASNRYVESAILAESGLAEMCESIWLVTAPEQVRIERVMARNGMAAGEVRARMESQRKEEERLRRCGTALKEIINI